MIRRAPYDERGSALVEVTWIGLILMLPLLWIVLSVFQVQRGAFATSGALSPVPRIGLVTISIRGMPARL